VLSKTSIPVVVLPLLTLAVTVATQLAMLLLSSVILLGSGVNAVMLWSNVPLFDMWQRLFVHLLAGHGLQYAPIYGWLLLVSAWARRAPFLWAVLPPVAIAGVEKIAFNTSHFGAILMHLIADPGPLSSPGLWIGLAITAAFLAAAIQLRRYRGPI
jgi:ABC-2 type transport system permease protein